MYVEYYTIIPSMINLYFGMCKKNLKISMYGTRKKMKKYSISTYVKLLDDPTLTKYVENNLYPMLPISVV